MPDPSAMDKYRPRMKKPLSNNPNEAMKNAAAHSILKTKRFNILRE